MVRHHIYSVLLIKEAPSDSPHCPASSPEVERLSTPRILSFCTSLMVPPPSRLPFRASRHLHAFLGVMSLPVKC